MKNSPGSMIGGIGLTICVREWQLSRTMPITSSTSSSSTPSMTVALDCLRNPPDEWRRVARKSRSRSASTSTPASSLWTMATTSFTGPSIAEAGATAAGAATAAVFAQDPDRNSLELLLTLGIADGDVAAYEADVVTNPDHPVHHAALDRTGSLGRTGATAAGAPMTGADLPLVVAGSGNVEACVGVLTFGWAGEHEVSGAEETLLVAVADLAAAAIATFRTTSMAEERAEWLERVALTDPLTG